MKRRKCTRSNQPKSIILRLLRTTPLLHVVFGRAAVSMSELYPAKYFLAHSLTFSFLPLTSSTTILLHGHEHTLLLLALLVAQSRLLQPILLLRPVLPEGCYTRCRFCAYQGSHHCSRFENYAQQSRRWAMSWHLLQRFFSRQSTELYQMSLMVSTQFSRVVCLRVLEQRLRSSQDAYKDDQAIHLMGLCICKGCLLNL